MFLFLFFLKQFCVFLHLLRREHEDRRHGCHRAEGQQPEGKAGRIGKVRTEEGRTAGMEFVKNFKVVEKDSRAPRILGSGQKIFGLQILIRVIIQNWNWFRDSETLIMKNWPPWNGDTQKYF